MNLIWETLASICLGAIAGILLKPIFRAYALEWPAQYSDVANVVDSGSSRNHWVYFVFRFVPVLLTSALLVGVNSAFELSSFWSIVALIVVHLAVTTLSPGVWRDVGRQSWGTKVRRVLVHSLSLLTVVFAAVIPYLLRRFTDVWTPSALELKEAFWGSLLIGALFLLYRKLTRFTEAQSQLSIQDILGRISKSNQSLVLKYARQYSTSPRFIISIVATENINRPVVLRRFERAVGLIFPKGTYGIAQIFSENPINDEESIRRLCRKYEGFFPVELDDRFKRVNLIAKFAEHNVGSKFIDQATSIYDLFMEEFHAKSDNVDYENDLPVLMLVNSRVVGAGVQIRFSVSSDVTQVSLECDGVPIGLKREESTWLDRDVHEGMLTCPLSGSIVIRGQSSDYEDEVTLKIDSDWALLS